MAAPSHVAAGRSRAVGRAVGVPAVGVAIALCASAGPLAFRDAAAQTAPAAPPATLPDEAAGNALVDAGKLPEGLAALVRAECLYRERGDRRGQVRVSHKQAATLRRLARFEESVAAAMRALSLADDDTKIRVSALTELGLLANDRGNTDRADTWLQQALPWPSRLGDGAAEALEHFERSVRAADRVGGAGRSGRVHR